MHAIAMSLLAASLFGGSADSGSAAAKYLQAAKQLYTEVEYESALDQLNQARKAAGVTPSEMVEIDIYTGLIQCDLGNWDAGRSSFRTALALNPEARLPKGVSPKIKVEWKLLQKQAAKHRAKSAPEIVVTPAPTPTPTPVLVPTPPSPAPTPPATSPGLAAAPTPSSPAGGLQASQQVEEQHASPAPYFVLGGAAVLAAAGGTFGLLSSHASSSAQNEPVQIAAQGNASTAHTDAIVANVCYGAAAAAATAGLIWLLAR